jgi:hypothetical protein
VNNSEQYLCPGEPTISENYKISPYHELNLNLYAFYYKKFFFFYIKSFSHLSIVVPLNLVPTLILANSFY